MSTFTAIIDSIIRYMDEHDAATQATTAIRVQLARLNMKQVDLARQIGVLPGTVSRALASSPLDERSKTWPAMLEALGLEIVIRPKNPKTSGE